MKFLLRFYREARFFFGLGAIVYAFLACQKIYQWNEMIFLNYWHHSDMLETCGLFFQQCSFPAAYYQMQNQIVIDCLWSVGTAVLLFLLFKAEELLQPEPVPYGGVHMRFKNPLPPDWKR